MIDFTEQGSKANDLAKAALDLLKVWEVAPTPPNFHVAYAHLCGRFPDVNAELKDLPQGPVCDVSEPGFEDGGDAPAPQVVLRRVYSAVFGGDERLRVLDETTQAVGSTINRAARLMGAANDGAARYGQRLSELSEVLTAPDSESHAAAMSATIAETTQMVAVNRMLEDKLKETVDEVARLRERLDKLEQQASTDALTGVKNRRMFDSVLREEMTAMDLGGDSPALILADIDHFKSFNDTYGHQVGDQVLRLVAQVIGGEARANDTVARYGGEEMAMILPATPLDQAMAVAERLRNAVAGRPLTNRRTGQRLKSITLSCGVAVARPGDTLESLVARCDTALYRAKDEGRNRVVPER